jgi:multiple antibiotic resistance protein
MTDNTCLRFRDGECYVSARQRTSSMDLLSATALLLVTTDPLGNVPSFIAILQPVPGARRRRVVVRELGFALLIMLAFWAGGRQLTGLLGIHAEAISIAGALVLFLIAIEMILPGRGRREEVRAAEVEPFIVPLAAPLVAGPSTLATIILITSQPGGLQTGFWAILIAWAVVFCTLSAAPAIMRVLGERGARAVERLMGMLLIMLAVQMFLNGLDVYLHQP